jgi:hypothetical protein
MKHEQLVKTVAAGYNTLLVCVPSCNKNRAEEQQRATVVFVIDVCPKNRGTITEEQQRATVVFVMDVCPRSCNKNCETIAEGQQRAPVVLDTYLNGFYNI